MSAGGHRSLGRLPNFFIIGAARAGTTSLYRYLDQHPFVFMSRLKEPRFFAFEGERLAFGGPCANRFRGTVVTDPSRYRKLFADAGAATAVGEASTLYLYSERAAEAIRRDVPEARLIAILRNPVDRAFSHFQMRMREGCEPAPDFAAAVADEPRRKALNWPPASFYRDWGFYHRQLGRYLDRFPHEQLRVFLYEDLVADPAAVTGDALRFLGIDDAFRPEVSARHNPSGVPRSRLVQSAVRKSIGAARVISPSLAERVGRVGRGVQARNLQRDEVTPAVRARLVEDFREDVLRLAELLGRDLAAWLRVEDGGSAQPRP